MPSLAHFIRKVRKAETPFYAFLYRMAKWILVARLPIPGFLSGLFRLLYHTHFFIRTIVMRVVSFFYREPLFRCRCEKAGKNMLVTLLPEVDSNTCLFFGDNVSMHGKLKIMSGKLFQSPRLVVGNNVHIGHLASFTVNREIVIEDGVLIASNCYFADTDAHPTDAAARAAGEAPPEEKIRPVRICRNAWIGHGCHVLKGVTIGEGSIIAAGSVVVESVPPYSIFAGNPGRVVATLRAPGSSIAERRP
jgi:acetyltransferase-like isoleucine patch superfamily enzyme